MNTLVLVCITEQRDGDGPVLVLERMELVGVARHAWDLLMMAYFGGRERDLAEMAALAADSGLDVRAVQARRAQWSSSRCGRDWPEGWVPTTALDCRGQPRPKISRTVR